MTHCASREYEGFVQEVGERGRRENSGPMCPSGTTVLPCLDQALNDTQRQSLLDWLRGGAMPIDQMGLDLNPALILISKV